MILLCQILGLGCFFMMLLSLVLCQHLEDDRASVIWGLTAVTNGFALALLGLIISG